MPVSMLEQDPARLRVAQDVAMAAAEKAAIAAAKTAAEVAAAKALAAANKKRVALARAAADASAARDKISPVAIDIGVVTETKSIVQPLTPTTMIVKTVSPTSTPTKEVQPTLTGYDYVVGQSSVSSKWDAMSEVMKKGTGFLTPEELASQASSCKVKPVLESEPTMDSTWKTTVLVAGTGIILFFAAWEVKEQLDRRSGGRRI